MKDNDVAITGDLARNLWLTSLRWAVQDQQPKKLKLEPKRRARATAQRRAK